MSDAGFARAVVADIGGTNARFAALRSSDPHDLSDIRVYPARILKAWQRPLSSI